MAIIVVAKVVYENKDWNSIFSMPLMLSSIIVAKVVYENKDWNI